MQQQSTYSTAFPVGMYGLAPNPWRRGRAQSQLIAQSGCSPFISRPRPIPVLDCILQ